MWTCLLLAACPFFNARIPPAITRAHGIHSISDPYRHTPASTSIVPMYFMLYSLSFQLFQKLRIYPEYAFSSFFSSVNADPDLPISRSHAFSDVTCRKSNDRRCFMRKQVISLFFHFHLPFSVILRSRQYELFLCICLSIYIGGLQKGLNVTKGLWRLRSMTD